MIQFYLAVWWVCACCKTLSRREKGNTVCKFDKWILMNKIMFGIYNTRTQPNGSVPAVISTAVLLFCYKLYQATGSCDRIQLFSKYCENQQFIANSFLCSVGYMRRFLESIPIFEYRYSSMFWQHFKCHTRRLGSRK